MSFNKNNSVTSNFTINSSFTTFNEKQKNLFDQLDVVEKNSKDLLSENTLMDTDDPVVDSIDDASFLRKKDIKKFCGKESIFKKPQTRAPKRFGNCRVPDYRKNPSKWTKYSLADVPSEDMSEKANTAAAMSFLKEMEDRKRVTNEEDADLKELPEKVTFRKVTHSKTDPNTSSTPVFQNSKWLMPEYVIGQKSTKSNKQKKLSSIDSIVTNQTKEVKLDHLIDED